MNLRKKVTPDVMEGKEMNSMKTEGELLMSGPQSSPPPGSISQKKKQGVLDQSVTSLLLSGISELASTE